MKEILEKRCEYDGTNYYYFQGLDTIFNFEHIISKNIVYIYARGIKITTFGTPEKLTQFLNAVA